MYYWHSSQQTSNESVMYYNYETFMYFSGWYLCDFRGDNDWGD